MRNKLPGRKIAGGGNLRVRLPGGILSCLAAALVAVGLATWATPSNSSPSPAPQQNGAASQASPHFSSVEAGQRVTFDGGSHGDKALPRVVSLLSVPKPMRYGQFLWNDKGVPKGRGWVLIDLDSQVISVFRGPHEIGTAVILYGADEKPTPRGRFPVIAKLKDHRSSLYDAPMPYTLRLTQDGIAIHGSDVVRGAATHGCIGVPTAFAAHVFHSVSNGDEVIIVGSKRAKGS